MKKYLIKATIFIIGLFVLDRLAFIVLQSQRPPDYAAFLDSKRAFFLGKGRWDILIFGDSHVADAIDTRTLKNFGYEAYNLGVYHASPFEVFHIASAAVRHSTALPKMAILGTNPIMFDRKIRVGKYTPLIIRNDFVSYSSLILNSEDGLSLKTLFYSAQEQYLLPYVIKKMVGIKYRPTREIVSIQNGHLEFYNQTPGISWGGGAEEADLSQVNPLQVEYFLKTIRLLKAQGIKVVVANPPIWKEREMVLRKSGKLESFEKLVIGICLSEGIQIINPNHCLAFRSLMREDFLNAEHVNYSGAAKYTTEVVTQLPLLNNRR